MPSPPYAAVYLDLDATLLDPDQIVTPRTRNALDALRARGVRIGIATGRTLRSARPHIEAAGSDAPAILFNGARVMGLDGTLHAETPVPQTAALALVDLARENDVFVNCYHGDQVRIEERNATSVASAEKDGVDQELVVSLSDLIQESAPTKLMMIAPAEKMAGFELAASALLEALGVDARVVRSEPTYLEALAAGVSKGAALSEVARLLDFTPAQIIAFGDGLNDLEMLQMAGLGVAVGNAHPDVKAVADRVCGSHRADGVATALEEIFGL